MPNQRQITEAALKNEIRFHKKYMWCHLSGIQLGIELALMLPQVKGYGGGAFAN